MKPKAVAVPFVNSHFEMEVSEAGFTENLRQYLHKHPVRPNSNLFGFACHWYVNFSCYVVLGLNQPWRWECLSVIPGLLLVGVVTKQ